MSMKQADSSLLSQPNHEIQSNSGQQCKKQHQRIAAALSIYHILKCAVRRSYLPIYHPSINLSIYKIAIFSICRIGCRNLLQSTFAILRQQNSPFSKTSKCLNNQCQVQQQTKKHQNIKIQDDFNNIDYAEYISSIKLKLHQINKKSMKSEHKHKQIHLQLQNKLLKLQNKKLQQSIQLANKRQERQNQKKKESLQMLAQQLGQKNQLIQDLRKNLRAYIDQSKTGGNVLEDDFISLKKQIQNLQKTKFKLQNEISKFKLEIELKIEQIIKLKQAIKNADQKQIKYRLLIAQYQTGIQKLTKTKSHYDQLIKFYNSKKKSLMAQCSWNNVNYDQKNYLTAQQYKIRLNFIFQFMKSIYKKEIINETEIKNNFDSNELQIIQNYKYIFDFQSKQNKLDKLNDHQNQQFSGIFSKSKEPNNECQTIIQILNSPLMHQKNENANHKINGQLSVLNSQIHKQIQKISQLKSKILRIREIVFIFLKTLQLGSDSKYQILQALNLVIQIFQYSQEELQQIMVKKKKVFGFI